MKPLAFKAWRRVAVALALAPLFVLAIQSGLGPHAYAGKNDAEQNVCINSDPTRGGIFTQVKITVSNASSVNGKLSVTYKEPPGTPQAGQEKSLINTGSGKFVTGVGSLAQRPCTSNPGIWVNAGSNANNPMLVDCTGSAPQDFTYAVKIDGKTVSSGGLSLCSSIRKQQLADSASNYTVATAVTVPVDSNGTAQKTGSTSGYFYIQRPSGKYRGIDQQGMNSVQVDGKNWTNFSVPINGGPDGGTSDKAAVKAGEVIVSGLPAGTHKVMIVYSDNGSLDAQGNQDVSPNNITNTYTVVVEAGKNSPISSSTAANPLLLGSALAAQGQGSADEGDASTGCSFSINPLTWIACPVAGILEEAIHVIDNIITNALTINTDSVFNTSGGYYKAWSSFRILATAIIIIAGIVMVASQALGFEFLDAYTIRKVLPRLLIAIIGISLSWPLMRFVVEFFNTLGYDIRNLIYSPFGDMGLNTLNAGALLAVGGGIVGTLFALGIFGTLSLLLTAALALLIGFVIIIVRDMAIIVLIIVVPIALACYILPNTQKVWKLWSTNFMGLMMMFPIISAFIAVGKVFSAVSRNPSGSDSPALGSSTVMQIIGFLAYFIPYFLLPIAFRLATGVIGSIAGFVNDRNRGIFDRLKKGRQARMADRMGRARSNNLWDNNSKVGKWANKAAGWATDPLDNAAYYGRNIPGFRKRGHRIASTIEGAAVEQSGKLAEEINKMGFNDKGLRALTGVHSGMSEGVQTALRAEGLYGKAPKSLPQLRRMAEILSAHGDGAEQNAANAIEGSMGRLSTLYQDPEMGKASVAAAGAMMLAQHGFLTPKDIPALGDVLTAQGGTSFAQSVISQAAMIGQRSRPDLKNGYGWMYDKTANNGKGGFVDGIHNGGPGGKRDLALVASTSSHDVAGAKGGYMDDMKDTYKEILTTARTDTTYQQASALKGTLSPEAWKAQSADIKRKAQAYDMYDAVKDQLFQWASPYSQASGDVKTKSLDFIDGFGLRNEFEQTKRTNMSPEQLDAMRAAGQNPEAQGQQGPGGGPGGPGH